MNETEFLEKLKNILNENCIVKLRKVDPRITHYELYVKLRDLDIKKIREIYPKVKIKYGLFKNIKSIILNGREGFTIYNIDGNKREKLIKKHEDEYKQKMDLINGKVIF